MNMYSFALSIATLYSVSVLIRAPSANSRQSLWICKPLSNKNFFQELCSECVHVLCESSSAITQWWVGGDHPCGKHLSGSKLLAVVSFNIPIRIDRTNSLHTSPLLKSSVITPTQNPLRMCDNMESLPTGTFMC